jgi:phytoene synthase
VDPLIEFVRRHDPDRFLTALFAPPARRGALLILYAFNHELARAREAVREPPLTLLRLHWWREVVEGTPKRHEVATALSAALAAGTLGRDDLLAMIDAREVEADGSIATRGAWLGYVRGTAGGLAVAAARALGAGAPERYRDLGAAYGVAGVLRAVPVLAAQGRCLLPADVLSKRGLSPEAVMASPDAASVTVALGELAEDGLAMLATPPRGLPRAAVAAALPAVLARRDLDRIRHRRPVPRARGLGDRLAVAIAALSAQVSSARRT